MQRNRFAAPRISTKPKPFTAAFALSVRVELQWVHSTLSAHPKRIRSPVLRTCFVDIPRDMPSRTIREHRFALAQDFPLRNGSTGARLLLGASMC